MYQRTHVLETLKNLASETGMSDKLQQIVTVSNKIDLVDADKRDSYIMPVSAETGLGNCFSELTPQKNYRRNVSQKSSDNSRLNVLFKKLKNNVGF